MGMLAATDISDATGLERALIGMTRAAALHTQSRVGELLEVLDEILSDESTPVSVQSIAEAWVALVRSSDDEALVPVARTLRKLAHRHKTDGLPYFAGISLNNAMCVELARGAYSEAIDLGRDALDQFRRLPVRTSELASLHSTLALCLAEAGNLEAAWDEVDLALMVGHPQADALGECAWLAATAGRTELAWSCLRQAERGSGNGYQELGSDLLLVYAEVVLAVSRGDVIAAESLLSTVRDPLSVLCGDRVRRLMLRALLATLQARARGRRVGAERTRVGQASGCVEMGTSIATHPRSGHRESRRVPSSCP